MKFRKKALYESQRELESQRLRLRQANQWADQAQRERERAISFCREINGKQIHLVHGFLSSLRRSVARSGDDKSCDVDVEDELLPEADDRPGTARGTKLSGRTGKENRTFRKFGPAHLRWRRGMQTTVDLVLQARAKMSNC